MRNVNRLLLTYRGTHAVLMITYERHLKAMSGINLTTENKLRSRDRMHDIKKARKQSTKARKDKYI